MSEAPSVDVFNSTWTTSFSNDSEGAKPGYPKFEFPKTDCAPDRVWPLIFLPDEVILQFGILYTKPEYILANYLVPIILIFGFLGNSVFLWTLVRINEMRTITTFYLANLAVADLFFIFCVAIRTFWANFLSRFMYTEPFHSTIGCAFNNIITYVAYYGSIGFVTLVSFERFFSICHPVKHRLIRSRRRTSKFIVATWLIAVITSIGLVGNSTTLTRFCILWPQREPYQNLLPSLTFCSGSSKPRSLFSYVLQTLVFILSLCMNLFMYIKIIQKLSGQNRVSPGQAAITANGVTPQETLAQRRVRNSAARMLIVTGVIFFICVAPWQFYIVTNTITSISGYEVFDQREKKVAIFLGTFFNCVNSSINPVIYGVTNPRYRVAFKRAILNCGTSENKDLASTLNARTTSSAAQ